MKRSELFCLCVCERDTVCVCVGGGGGVGACMPPCVRVYIVIVKHFLVSEPFLFPCFIESLCFIVKCIECFM